MFAVRTPHWSLPSGYGRPTNQPTARAIIWLPALAILAFTCCYRPLTTLLATGNPFSHPAAARGLTPITPAPSPSSSPATAASLPSCTPTNLPKPDALLLDGRGPGVSIQVEPTATYHIYGNTADDLRSQIQRCAPGGSSTSNAAYTSETSYNLSWQYSVATSGSSCQLIGAKVGVHIITILPDWQAAATATEGLDGRWQSFLTSLISHEQGHAMLDKAYGAKLVQDLDGLSPLPCPQLAATAKAIVQADVDALNAANNTYDAQTDHGASQGAVLPTY